MANWLVIYDFHNWPVNLTNWPVFLVELAREIFKIYYIYLPKSGR